MIEVPEELIERALQGWPRIVDTPKGMGRHECLVRHVLAAVLPDLIAAIEATYEQVGWYDDTVTRDGKGRTTYATLSPFRFAEEDHFDRAVPVFVRRVP